MVRLYGNIKQANGRAGGRAEKPPNRHISTTRETEGSITAKHGDSESEIYNDRNWDTETERLTQRYRDKAIETHILTTPRDCWGRETLEQRSSVHILLLLRKVIQY